MDPAVFTDFFVKRKSTKKREPLVEFDLPYAMERIYLKAIRKPNWAKLEGRIDFP